MTLAKYILAFSVALPPLVWFWSGMCVGRGDAHRSRHKGGGAAEKNYRLDNRANIKEIQAQNRQVGKQCAAAS